MDKGRENRSGRSQPGRRSWSGGRDVFWKAMILGADEIHNGVEEFAGTGDTLLEKEMSAFHGDADQGGKLKTAAGGGTTIAETPVDQSGIFQIRETLA